MRKLFLVTAIIAIVVLFQYCSDNASSGSGPGREEAAASSIKPVPLPDPGIPGFRFPEDSVVITSWVDKNQEDKIAAHGWGIWTALTQKTGQVYNGDSLRVFETWFTPEDIAAATIASKQNRKLMGAEERPFGRGNLKTPHQFLHQRQMKLGKNNSDKTTPDDLSRILGFVKYDPTAADFAIKNKLYDSSVLQQMINKGQQSIPEFPNTSITTKPVFQVIKQSDLVNGYYPLKVWTGPPATAIGYPSSDWPSCVYVDLNNKSAGNGSVDSGCQNRTPQNTYNVNEFIHFKLDQQTAQTLKENFSLDAKEGDVAILLAMHVTSKEIRRWTWQTYWWAPNADAPPAPSNSIVVNNRPAQLQGEARHYAMAIAYTFINPNQPFTGGNNVGTSIYAYNPYLEAGFDEGTFYEPATVLTAGQMVVNNVGVRTNCMSCHALANFAPTTGPSGPGYMGDTYIDMNGSRFKGVLQLDFLWSIQGNIIEDTAIVSLKSNSVRPLNTVKK